MPGDTELVPYDDFDSHFPGHTFGQRHRDNGSVDSLPLFYRSGTPEAKGVRVTLRGDLREAILGTGEGFLGVRRGRCYMVPLALLRQWFGAKLQHQHTLDITINPRRLLMLGPAIQPVDVALYQGT
jgi:hypothetical protein